MTADRHSSEKRPNQLVPSFPLFFVNVAANMWTIAFVASAAVAVRGCNHTTREY
jgi:hypothetical protein